jgi:hypothetical protein
MDIREPDEPVKNDDLYEWPEPTEPMPDEDTLITWFTQASGCETTDGCWVEGDGLASRRG